MFTFRTSITCAVMAFVVAVTALLVVIQVQILRSATAEAASAYMDATTTQVFSHLQTQLTAVASLVRILSTSSSVADSDERTEAGRAIPLFQEVLLELPQLDSIYVGFENGAWLQVRSLNGLNAEQRERLRAAPRADFAINLVRPTLKANCPCGGFL